MKISQTDLSIGPGLRILSSFHESRVEFNPELTPIMAKLIIQFLELSENPDKLAMLLISDKESERELAQIIGNYKKK